ncbi:uncharacterized protein LOC129287158 [Prosopis cineraria]|uniref:uncharacterized protein LOC129287158 n=1 Tax=Prosopis cineraria TaxID=364024 RepID=UPI002410AE83|nr:uncharacterized protein LOC129287158 [Prosopis cineraria]XP_054779306.1 uncharacterized protein LOC129287158 [Prosopis cineraria]XP_054779307.1 uncharacterized protein LOC129287158 [Prosopis cineraria]
MRATREVGSGTRTMIIKVVVTMTMMFGADGLGANFFGSDTNEVYSPCEDAKVQKRDGFTFGIAFSEKDSFYENQGGPQLSPCDRRLDLSNKGAQLALFRPMVDEMSLLTINTTTLDPVQSGGYMVAFAGQKYAARSPPIKFADQTHTITSLTLILEFGEGTLQNLYWKSFGCDKCAGDNVCLNNQDCAVPNSKCHNNGGSGCNIGIQLAFSGTDRSLNVLNSWYEVDKLRQYSLYGLFSDLKNSIITPYEDLF